MAEGKANGKRKSLTPEVKETLEQIRSRQLRLWSDAPLCAVWSFARTLPPPPEPLESQSPEFADSSKPMAVDIGCGFGGYVLGMAGREVRPSPLEFGVPPNRCYACIFMGPEKSRPEVQCQFVLLVNAELRARGNELAGSGHNAAGF